MDDMTSSIEIEFVHLTLTKMDGNILKVKLEDIAVWEDTEEGATIHVRDIGKFQIQEKVDNLDEIMESVYVMASSILEELTDEVPEKTGKPVLIKDSVASDKESKKKKK